MINIVGMVRSGTSLSEFQSILRTNALIGIKKGKISSTIADIDENVFSIIKPLKIS